MTKAYENQYILRDVVSDFILKRAKNSMIKM